MKFYDLNTEFTFVKFDITEQHYRCTINLDHFYPSFDTKSYTANLCFFLVMKKLFIG